MTYRFKSEITRQTTAVVSVAHLERGLGGQEFRGNFPVYVRTIDIQLRNEFGDITPDGELQMHMAIREEFRNHARTVAEEGK